MSHKEFEKIKKHKIERGKLGSEGRGIASFLPATLTFVGH